MNSIIQASKSMGVKSNVCIRVLDANTKEVIQEHVSHNVATNSMLTGIAHYLTGDGVLNQAEYMLSSYIPRYISLGTMGLINQESDDDGLPAGIGESIPDIQNDPEYKRLVNAMNAAKARLDAAQEAFDEAQCQPILLIKSTGDALKSFIEYYDSDESYPKIVWPKIPDKYSTYLDMYEQAVINCECCNRCSECSARIRSAKQALEAAQRAYDAASKAVLSYGEERRFRDYMSHCPGYGADGYDQYLNNGRKYFGLGPVFAERSDKSASIGCELVSDSFPRVDISYRDVVPEIEAELPRTIDVVFSAMISTGALKQFRESGRNYIYITECGLWSKKDWEDSGDNGLLAAYRIISPNEWQRQMVAANLTTDAIRQYLISTGISNPTDAQIASADKDAIAQYNRTTLKRHIIKVGLNQVVQVIWKIQLGSIDEFASMQDLRKLYYQIDEEQGNLNYVEAVMKLRSIRNKYQGVSGLDDVFDAIDRIQ